MPAKLKVGAGKVRRRRLAALVALLSILALFSASVFLRNPLRPLLSPLEDLDNAKQLFGQWQRDLGPWMPAVFILLHAIQVVVVPMPGEVTGILAGYLFGVYGGFLYSLAGLVLGSGLNFCLGRWLGNFLLRRVLPAEILDHFSVLFKREGRLIAFLLFLLPGFPKDFLSYFLGMTPMTLGTFLAVMSAGRAPATYILAFQGSQAASGNYQLFLGLIAAAAILAAVFYGYREKMYGWVLRGRKESKNPPTGGTRRGEENSPLQARSLR